jgi:hypothetical protein
MAVSGGGDGSLCDQRTPGEGDEVKHVRILQVSVAVVSAVQDHRVLAHHTGTSVPGARGFAVVVNLVIQWTRKRTQRKEHKEK